MKTNRFTDLLIAVCTPRVVTRHQKQAAKKAGIACRKAGTPATGRKYPRGK